MLNNSNAVDRYRAKTNSILIIAEDIFNSDLGRIDKVLKLRNCIDDWRKARPYQCGATNKICFPAHTILLEYLTQLKAEEI